MIDCSSGTLRYAFQRRGSKSSLEVMILESACTRRSVVEYAWKKKHYYLKVAKLIKADTLDSSSVAQNDVYANNNALIRGSLSLVVVRKHSADEVDKATAHKARIWLYGTAATRFLVNLARLGIKFLIKCSERSSA